VVSILTLSIGVFGALIGSFLNVVIYRMPAGRSIVSPPSACGSCGARVRSWDNIPVVSWLLLRGRCRDCSATISIRYPAVELGTAVLFGMVAWWALSVMTPSNPGASIRPATILTVIAFLYLASIGIALALIDLDTRKLPNRIVLPAYPVSAVLLTGAALFAGEQGRLLTALVGAVALFGLYLALALAYPGGMGLGDVKLAGVLGMYLGWLGWGPLAVGAFSAFLLGGLLAIVLLGLRRVGRKDGIPFGPWMIAGAWVGILGGDAIATGYLSLFDLV
jgi:prepilin signal peptidase PulO-like enzyme (type II secretory pathway)